MAPSTPLPNSTGPHRGSGRRFHTCWDNAAKMVRSYAALPPRCRNPRRRRVFRVPCPAHPRAPVLGSSAPPGLPTTTIRTGLPDPAVTAGAIDPRVTQANIDSTICVSGYTQTVRPPASYTDHLKIQQMAAAHLPGPTSAYEEDHLIALEIGGNPTDPRNLFPEPRTGPPGTTAADKDKVENAAHRAVCARTMSLAAVQRGMATDWIALGQQLGVK